MGDKTLIRLYFEVEQVDQLFVSYAELLSKARTDEPDLVELTALASVLHSFYNGLEAIFTTIARDIDGEIPEGGHWHRDLLMKMSTASANRNAVLTLGTALRLADYLAFRHFYRHSYSFYLIWGELEGLVLSLAAVWLQAKEELAQFFETLEVSS